MAWEVQDATWGDLPLRIQQGSDEVSRRLVAHQYPSRDGASHEDLGRAPTQVRLTALITGPGWRAELEAFRAAAEAAETRELVHPLAGTMNARLERVSVSYSSDAQNMAVVELQFIEDQLDSVAFVATTGTPATLTNEARAAADAATLAVEAL